MTFGAANLVHVGKSLLRYWGVTLLNVLGLATGFAAAIIIGLYVRNELGFDRFIPDADKVLMLSTVYSRPGSPLVSNDKAPAGMTGWLRSDAPEVDAIARLYPVEWSVRSPRYQSLEYMYWADANFFDLLRARAVYGDLKTALTQPYSMVLTQRVARRYFGHENVVGQTLLINGGSPVTVTAVLADFPANTSLDREIYLSGSSSYGMLAAFALHPEWQWASSYTFVRLKPGAHLTTDKVKAIAASHWHNTFTLPVRFNLTPLPQMHFQPEADSPMAPRGHMDTVVAMSAVAGVILLLAAVNFAGMMTAQIDERRGEMVIRSSLGAQRQSLFLHVFCEAAAITGLATLGALALVERLLPVINPVLGLKLSLWTSPPFTLCFALAAIVTGLSAGLYPATALSAVQPGQGARSAGKARPYLGRVGWITAQFALLISLLISSQIVYRQWAFATGPSLNFDGANVVQITVYTGSGLETSFKQHLLALDGVTGAAYSRFVPDDQDIRPGWATSPSGQTIQFERQSVDTDFFRMFGVPLLAGRNFSDVYFVNVPPREVILTKSAALALGYARPSDAVGKTLDYFGDNAPIHSKIIGVAGDMRLGSLREPMQPMVFDNQSFFFTRLNVKLRPGDEAATVAAIDRVWKQDYPTANNPIDRHFYSEHLTSLYNDMNQQWWAYGLLSLVGLCLSVMGLSGLSIYLARTRMREIAIRNALGARWWDIVLLRLEPFVKPLIAANVIAALASGIVMSLWLDAFTAHVRLDPMPFLYAGGATLLITLAVLTTHTLMSTPARSSQPLRTD